MALSQDRKVDSDKVYDLFEGKCFNCSKSLKRLTGPEGFRLDHTLPARLLWPLSEGATLLCSECNNAKHDRWPSEFYDEGKIRRLAVLTGITYDVLAGKPFVSPSALSWIEANTDAFIERWIIVPGEIKRLRDLILDIQGIDIYGWARHVPDSLR